MPAGGWTRWTPGTRPRMCGPSCPGPTSSSTLLRRGCSGCSDCTPARTSAPLPQPARPADSEAERRAATGRMLDHYLHTAHSAALQLHPTRRPVTLSAPQPGAEPEHIGDTAQALAWFGAERRVLMAAAGRALEAGFDTHVWQIAWALSRFLDTR